MPKVILIAGPNGAGKSTLAPHLLRDNFGIDEYVNADVIAMGLSAYAPATVAIQAGRIMLARIHELAERQVDFAFETTLATRSYGKRLGALQEQGYLVHIIFLWLDSPDLAIKRVASRVADGGHGIPEATVRRRYDRGLTNLFRLYLPLADSWQMLDMSYDEPADIAYGAKISGITLVDEILWRKIER